MSAPAGDDDGGCSGGRVKAQVQAGGDGHGGKDVDGADGGTGQGGQDAGQDAEDKDQDEGVDVVAQHTGDGLADQVGQAGAAQSVGDADDAGGHQDDGGADGVADLVEVHDAEDQQGCDGQAGDGVAGVADDALQDHADDGDHKADVGDELFLLGQGDLMGVRGGLLRGGDGVVRHDLVGDQAPHQEADGQGQVDEGELDQVDVRGSAGRLQHRDDDAVLQRGVEGQQRVVCGKARRHQHLGGRQALAVGQVGQQADDQHVVGGRAGAEQAAPEHDDEDQQDVGKETALARHLKDGVLELDDEAGFLQRCDDRHERGEHHDGGVGEAAEGGLDVGHAEDDQQQQSQQRRRAEGQFVHHDQDDHEDGNSQGNNHGCCHVDGPPFFQTFSACAGFGILHSSV